MANPTLQDLPTSPSSPGLFSSASWPASSAATPEVLTTTDAGGFQTLVTLPASVDTGATALSAKGTAAPLASGAACIASARATFLKLVAPLLAGVLLLLLA
jgi:hypothetical protein